MTERYKARYGMIWKNSLTGKVYSRYIELESSDNILNYIQIKDVKEDFLTNKSFFNNKEEY